MKDDRLNILALHDEKHLGEADYDAALLAAGYSPAGLFSTVIDDATPIPCAKCHVSNALPGTGLPGISALTSAIHSVHANVLVESQEPLDGNPTHASYYPCHPGFDTQCLRGAMGKAIGADGQFAMDCQSCHTGSATVNSGEVRFGSAFDANGEPRVAASNLFATTDDVPQSGFSLYRFSTGHGDLQCAACHGPPHAIYPTTVDNYNVQSMQLHGHAGTIMECSTCHGSLEDDELDQGPYGMHATSQKWVTDAHKDPAEHNLNACKACHGANSRGTVLAETHSNLTYNTPWGTKQFVDGQGISCYTCHDGPDDDDAPNNTPPVVANLTVNTPLDAPLVIPLQSTDQNGYPLTYRIVDQQTSGAFGRLSNGTVGLAVSIATFYPGEALGPVSFTYAAHDGDIESNLGTVIVEVLPPICPEVVEPYGFGCAANTGFVPELNVTDCPEPGGQLTFEVTGATGGAYGFFVYGTGRGIRELGTGCVLRVDPLVQLVPIIIGPGGPGQGSLTIPFTVPTNATGTLNFQVFVRQASAGFIGTFTNAIELQLP